MHLVYIYSSPFGEGGGGVWGVAVMCPWPLSPTADSAREVEGDGDGR